MNEEKTHQTNPMAPWDPLDALLTPWDPEVEFVTPVTPGGSVKFLPAV